MLRTRLTLAALCVVAPLILAVPSNATHSGKKPLPTPTFVGGSALLRGNTVVFDGTFRVKGKSLPVSASWKNLALQDASGAPLPVAVASGRGRSLAVPVAGAYGLTATFTVKTVATKTHRAATHTTPVAVLLGGFTAVGTAVPTLGVWADQTYPYMGWSGVLTVDASSRTVHLPDRYLAPPVMGACSWQPLPPGPPTNSIPHREGAVTSTGLTVYGGRFACPDSHYFVVPQIIVNFLYANGESCELPVGGTTTFTPPPDWGGVDSFYAVLLTLNEDGTVYSANQEAYAVSEGFKDQPVNVCEKYHLPPINTAPIPQG